MKKTLDCLGMGIAPVDILYQIKQYPRPGAKIDALDMTIQGGGPIPTAMATLARLGLHCGLIAAIGSDLFGKFVINELEDEGVDISRIIIKKKPTAIACGCFEDGSGRRTIVLNLKIRVNPRDFDFDQLPKVRTVHLDGRDLPACMKLARWAKKQDIPVIFDVGSMRNDVTDILPLVDHLVCAQDFALPYTKAGNIIDSIRRLSRLCPGTIVVTSGINGSIGYCREEGLAFANAFRVKTVDTTGAGDVYHGGYIFGLLKNWRLDKRMKFASAAAAIKCTKPGGRVGIPNLLQVESFLKKGPRVYA